MTGTSSESSFSDIPSSPVSDFITARERDAWFVIRGFVFQVERSVQRWVRLTAGEILELECGEDISQVSPSLLNGTWREERVLEQIKSFKEKNVTLRNGLEALANFVEHQKYNPSSNESASVEWSRR